MVGGLVLYPRDGGVRMDRLQHAVVAGTIQVTAYGDRDCVALLVSLPLSRRRPDYGVVSSPDPMGMGGSVWRIGT